MMQDQIIPVNNEALSRALNAVVGLDAAKLVGEAYKAIDAAMAFGYTKGVADERKRVAEEEAANEPFLSTTINAQNAAAETAAFTRGWDASGLDYDDGYVDGVSDARAFPAYADDEVARLTAETEYNEANVSDSGDETPSDGAIYAAVSARDDIRAAEGNTSDI